MGWPGSWMVWYGGPIPLVLPSALDLLMEGGICSVATTGCDGCKTFSHPRNLGDLFSMAGSSVTLTTASPLGVLAGFIPMLWGIASLT